MSDANENSRIAKVADLVSRDIDIWIRSNIPYQNRRETVKMIQKLYDEYKLVKKNLKRRNPGQIKKEKTFVLKNSKLFDISRKSAKIKCEEDKKFLLDQKSTREMMISLPDAAYNKKVNERISRKNKHKQYLKKKETAENQVIETSIVDEDELSDVMLQSLSSNDDDWASANFLLLFAGVKVNQEKRIIHHSSM